MAIGILINVTFLRIWGVGITNYFIILTLLGVLSLIDKQSF